MKQYILPLAIGFSTVVSGTVLQASAGTFVVNDLDSSAMGTFVVNNLNTGSINYDTMISLGDREAQENSLAAAVKSMENAGTLKITKINPDLYSTNMLMGMLPDIIKFKDKPEKESVFTIFKIENTSGLERMNGGSFIILRSDSSVSQEDTVLTDQFQNILRQSVSFSGSGVFVFDKADNSPVLTSVHNNAADLLKEIEVAISSSSDDDGDLDEMRLAALELTESFVGRAFHKLLPTDSTLDLMKKLDNHSSSEDDADQDFWDGNSSSSEDDELDFYENSNMASSSLYQNSIGFEGHVTSPQKTAGRVSSLRARYENKLDAMSLEAPKEKAALVPGVSVADLRANFTRNANAAAERSDAERSESTNERRGPRLERNSKFSESLAFFKRLQNR